MVVLVQCPRCHNRMKYQSKDGVLEGKTKACVYCGYSMSVSKYVVTAPPSMPMRDFS